MAGVDRTFDAIEAAEAAYAERCAKGYTLSAFDATASDSDDGRDTIHITNFYRKEH